MKWGQIVMTGTLCLLVACSGVNGAAPPQAPTAAPVSSTSPAAQPSQVPASGTAQSAQATVPADVINQQVTGVPATPGAASVTPPTTSGVSPLPSLANIINNPNSQWLTWPAQLPSITATIPAQNTGDGDIFLSNFVWGVTGNYTNTFLMIVDNSGQPIFYRSVAPNFATDFKKQPNGMLSYYVAPSNNAPAGYYEVMDSSYNVVARYQVQNGFTTDLHDLQLLPDGRVLLLGIDTRTIDMSKLVPGGQPNASVIGAVIQELDSSKKVVFQWNSWDHFLITDTTESVTVTQVDPVHANAIALDTDGNILLSSRHMDEITKINIQTGDIMWRLGGKHNQFAFTNDQPFIHQHDVRVLPNGNISLFDNRKDQSPKYSRAVEYKLDESAKTITKLWEYRASPDAYTEAMGNVQQLSNGDMFIGWGSSTSVLATEAKPDGTAALQLSAPGGNVSYRAFRFPWHATPSWDPTLAIRTDGDTTTLGFSWNGATDIASFRIYGGDGSGRMQLISTQPKAGFETQFTLTNSTYCSYQVMPVDNQGHDTRSSNVVTTGSNCQG